ncbi:MAG: NifB/NifX family molybdenum-iron cluster-binding protein [Methylicorpusculum sp.]|uniref:NifB/NifX family molybdenum-iron cluster-binding protein n=1 Tax=Methylicorpusculum sp. TaxID=2713644 RepID=UPI0027199161|nr:NifB/NifX family molybdenum-iron cluster-binding protein [Methylicorpusculum sp.]MDO8846553.1 NifB/NifX family molybdenum-iron cluster-binding protein [Methylicorpusculum sp.]MDO8939556.1 NifB/NifX family molybdenum-iron cluster-binding protein [Methylicorpusculum sp.]MDP2178728.1 NifB/NifX family molybdenum-iron cluster-binding protein [Methylicorpusculum sp.]MDP2201282.1 NifB/NifX family molybdenum-iron cluster-binding protein [Methylicorpusculum sp.]MDP3531660.1 NifB/NifX family molybden
MNKPNLNRDLALRIGLAARSLPDIQTKLFMTVLTECTGLPLTEESVDSLDKARFNAIFKQHGREFNKAVLDNALSILKTVQPEEIAATDQPVYQDGEMPGSIRIAIGSQDGFHVDGHFSSCLQFMIYQISTSEIRPIDIRPIQMDDARKYSDKNEYRADLIADCQILHIASIGGAAAAKIVKKGVHLIKIGNHKTIASVLEQLQHILVESPPPWLAKVMGIEGTQRFRFEKQEPVL